MEKYFGKKNNFDSKLVQWISDEMKRYHDQIKEITVVAEISRLLGGKKQL